MRSGITILAERRGISVDQLTSKPPTDLELLTVVFLGVREIAVTITRGMRDGLTAIWRSPAMMTLITGLAVFFALGAIK